MFKLKLREVGSSSVLALPEEMLQRLNVKAGQQIFAIETLSGYTITSLEPGVRKQVEAGEAMMDRYGGITRLGK